MTNQAVSLACGAMLVSTFMGNHAAAAAEAPAVRVALIGDSTVTDVMALSAGRAVSP